MTDFATLTPYLVGFGVGVLYLALGLALLVWADNRHNRVREFSGDSNVRPFLVILLWPLAILLLSLPRRGAPGKAARS